MALLRSFSFALAGLGYLVRTQRNFRIELAIGAVAVAAAAASRLERWEWVVLAMTIAVVLILEAVNTAIETAVTLASPRFRRPCEGRKGRFGERRPDRVRGLGRRRRSALRTASSRALNREPRETPPPPARA